MKLEVQSFFDPVTCTLTYIVWDARSRDALVIDSVLDFDPATRMTSKASLNQVTDFLLKKNLTLHWLLETHAHADHLSAARELRERFPGARWAMGARMQEVFQNFKRAFAWPDSVKLENLRVDRWLSDGEDFACGSFRVKAIATPGHTPACMTFEIGRWLFTGDALFMPDSGVGRCDFPGGSADQLYDSVWGKLFAKPSDYEIFVGHDYQPGGRPVAFRIPLKLERQCNIHLNEAVNRADFIRFRENRDRSLSAPRLLAPSLDWNLGAHQIVKRD